MRALGTLDDAPSDRQSRSDRDYGERVDRIAYSADSRWLAVVEPVGGRLHVWTLPAGEHRQLELGTTDLEDLAFLPDGRLAIAGSDGGIRILELATGRSFTLAGHRGPIEDLAVSATGRLASAGTDGAILVWDLPSVAPRKLASGRSGVVRIAISTDGSMLAAASEDRTVALWDVMTGTQRPLLALGRSIIQLVISDDNRTIAVASSDGAHACDVQSARCRELYGKAVYDIAVSARGEAIVGGLATGHVIAWPDDLPRDEPQLRAWLAQPTP